MRTLRARTTALATAVTALVLAGAALILVATLSTQLTGAGDAADRGRVQDLLDLAATGALPARLDNLGDEAVAQVVGDTGTVLAASPNITDRPPLLTEPPAVADESVQRTIEGPDDNETERYRVWVGRGESPDGPVTVVVGRSLESVDEATRTLRGSLLLGIPLLLALLALVTWSVVGRALGRIDDITTTVDSIDGDGLDRRVPATGVDDEVGRLATTMNRMLDRLAETARQQAAFVADASHDLQSPLTALRTELEVALVKPDDIDVAPWARQLLAISTEMELLVQDLVALAVLEAGTAPVRQELIDLDELVLEEAARARPATALQIDTVGVSAAPVRGDAVALRRLARNLLDNASAHALRRVVVALGTGPDGVVLDVVDDGPGVADEDRERVFDRFYRGDPARRHGAGSGLGLAIARQVAEGHGGSLGLVRSADGSPTSHFRLVLPRPDPIS